MNCVANTIYSRVMLSTLGVPIRNNSGSALIAVVPLLAVITILIMWVTASSDRQISESSSHTDSSSVYSVLNALNELPKNEIACTAAITTTPAGLLSFNAAQAATVDGIEIALRLPAYGSISAPGVLSGSTGAIQNTGIALRSLSFGSATYEITDATGVSYYSGKFSFQANKQRASTGGSLYNERIAGNVVLQVNSSNRIIGCGLNIPAAPLNCNATTISHCALAATPSGGSSGTCAATHPGTCQYTCSNGVWGANSNLCRAGCPAAVINGCTLAARAHGQTSGSCAAGYTGSCTYTCNNGN